MYRGPKKGAQIENYPKTSSTIMRILLRIFSEMKRVVIMLCYTITMLIRVFMSRIIILCCTSESGLPKPQA